MNVQEIMTTQVVCISDQANLKDAHALMNSRNVRHLPVISEQDSRLVGILTHKKMVSIVMSLVTKYGSDALDRKERAQTVASIMDTDHQHLTVDEPLSIVVEYFIDNKLGCLPVIDDAGNVKGIVTSSDFVKLCAKLLKHSKE
ncbi:CBS domain-containing protein [Shewanella eurypsychrophilus]|uniref:CBS domain-containing protein n=1 Tax=Shewanella eurypsychrophilus TaxID=2593656 RepID=A0ABX6V8F9_9GAMM|nr:MULTISPECIES: CBS domain-containing protein [Shewanella]QFU21491.1 CBS domain-containing protein [Shewanella sp. YLB-09]QPG56781.1 CBS domain-containing protein [Shewanella eurypsychrophilus]